MSVDRVAAAKRAIAHLDKFGDTDLFPSLPEMRCYSESADSVAAEFEKLTAGNYRPQHCIESLTPKGALGFRISHQLSATDNIIYLAATIIAAKKLEAYRTSDESRRSFAYRFVESKDARLFIRGRSFHDWINYITKFGRGDNPFGDMPYGIMTDISDYYQRIYFHRIENMLADCECDALSSNLIKKLIQKVRAKQSFGIPVGSNASRILAEALLTDVDKLLESKNIPATRYVDDFRILAISQKDAHSVLCVLAEYLMITEGLSLNTSKTKIVKTEELRKSATKRLDDAFTSKELLELEEYIRLEYGEDEADEEDDLTEDASKSYFMTADKLFDKMDELSSGGDADISIYKAILRALRFLPNVKVDRLLDNHRNLLYFIPREFCLLLRSALNDDPGELDSVKKVLLSLINTSPFSDLTFVRAWVLDLFTRGPLIPDPADFTNYDFSRSTYEKRYHLLLRGIWEDRHYFRAQRTKFSDFSDWEQPCLLLGAMCLPEDEYKTWVDSVSDDVPGAFPKIYVKWLKDSHGSFPAILKDQ
jgi:retron-type reverse transcriptase